MTTPPDLIRQLLQMVMDAQPSFSEERAMQIEVQIRHQFGGERYFIAKRAPMLRKARAKVRAEIGTRPDAEIIAEHGISRRTLYRWIKTR